MSKDTLDPTIICAFLQTHFDPKSTSVNFIGAGWFSQAFTFAVDQRAFVFRVNAYEEDFQKDAFAYQHFSSAELPIPRVVQIGQFDEARFYAITEHCAGEPLDEEDTPRQRAIVPQLFAALDAIHCVNVSGFAGWGLADANGNGHFASWSEYLRSLYNQKFAYDWREIARHTFLEHDVFAAWFETMERLLPYCAREKYLIHRDFGFNNVISDGKRITGVLDWAEFGLGDFLYDVANLDFFSKGIPYGALWLELAIRHGRAVPHFEERMICYMLNIGLGSMAIAAVQGDEKSYIRCRERTRSVLKPGRRSVSDWTQ